MVSVAKGRPKSVPNEKRPDFPGRACSSIDQSMPVLVGGPDTLFESQVALAVEAQLSNRLPRLVVWDRPDLFLKTGVSCSE